MSWSMAEAKSLATRAARGGGLPWGLAEEAGFAVQWLQAHGAPGAEALALLLEWQSLPGNDFSPVWMFDNVSEPAGVFNPIALGAALIDANRCNCSGLGRVCQPLLLVPFIAAIAPATGSRLIWNDVSIEIGHNGVQVPARREILFADTASCYLSAADDDEFAPTLTRERVTNDDAAAIARLGAFAARTYAPATEASRLAGAGAGLSDND